MVKYLRRIADHAVAVLLAHVLIAVVSTGVAQAGLNSNTSDEWIALIWNIAVLAGQALTSAPA